MDSRASNSSQAFQRMRLAASTSMKASAIGKLHALVSGLWDGQTP